jgi:hypothetical protein
MTKEEFLAVYNRHQPNAWTRFAFMYFSQETTEEDGWLRRCLIIILLSLFVLGFFGVVINWDDYVKWLTLPFGVILFGVVITMLGGGLMNNIRIRKISRELGISIGEYNHYANLYL